MVSFPDSSAPLAQTRRFFLALSAAVFVGALALVALLAFAGMAASNVARAYVTGEAQYSKAQKEAVIDLMRFARTGQDRDFADFEASLSVVRGDAAARRALEARPSDLAAARAGFASGRNAPPDVSTLIHGFQVFRGWPPFAAAVEDWRAADRGSARLQALGETMRRNRLAGVEPTSADLAEVEAVDREMSRFERQFSDHMGSVARQASSIAFTAVGALSLAVCLGGLAVGWRVQRQLTRIGADLAAAKARAEDSNRAKSDFLANMSHEIRTPLTGIMGFAELLQRAPDLSPRARTHVGRIATSSELLLHVVNDILDFSKIEAGAVELEPLPVDLRAWVAETLALVASGAERKGLDLVFAGVAGAPSHVLVDPARLRQILLNLLTNAVKFTERGGIEVSGIHERGVLRLSVKDTGRGLSKPEIERLFQRFSQADGSINRQFGGTGLGLAICKNLSELMGGEIGVESVEGAGSTFWFAVQAPATEAAAAAPAAPEPVASGPSARILVVDDVAQNRELVSAILGACGHDVHEAPGGLEAIVECAHRRFDLILMDLQMPAIDGLETTRIIRRESPLNPRTPILALSANVGASDQQACLDAGMNDHVGKPINTRELLEKIALWTG